MSPRRTKVRVDDPPLRRLLLTHQGFVFHVYGHKNGVCGVVISDPQYPSLAAHQLLGDVVSEFLAKFPANTWDSPNMSMPELKEKLIKFQKPEEVDKIGQIQRELDDTKNVLHQTIESVLGRQEKLDELVGKSNDLSDMSKGFYSAFLTTHPRLSAALLIFFFF
jgi:synaptobrevin family protein YKT6